MRNMGGWKSPEKRRTLWSGKVGVSGSVLDADDELPVLFESLSLALLLLREKYLGRGVWCPRKVHT